MGNLIKCPFCGGEASARITYKGTYAVSCNRLCVGQYGYDTEKEAIEAWNTRKPMEAVVAELEKLPQYRWEVTMHTAEDYVKVSDLRKVIEIAREEGEEHDDKLQESQ